ncbi:hypothetical protein EVAR_151_1 [Eumeta japonica]|uniref:Uncharacterized protein n=1 Tax=Eumeta variegata TaxID=151549 RepID=A0A4C1S8J3_EUMVA|nr:hypothetical protein EVAR_151_1 [Eumeta japonica]
MPSSVNRRIDVNESDAYTHRVHGKALSIQTQLLNAGATSARAVLCRMQVRLVLLLPYSAMVQFFLKPTLILNSATMTTSGSLSFIDQKFSAHLNF